MVSTERVSKFSKRTSMFPVCYLCVYTWTENYIKAILRVIRSSNCFPRGRNKGTFYSSSSSFSNLIYRLSFRFTKCTAFLTIVVKTPDIITQSDTLVSLLNVYGAQFTYFKFWSFEYCPFLTAHIHITYFFNVAQYIRHERNN